MLVAAAVESGSLAVIAESAIEVTRSDGSTETISPPTPVFVHEGDSFIYPNAANESLSGFSNPGPGPLSILQAIWFPNPECSYGQSDSPARAQIAWVSYDRLPALESPMAFDLKVQRVTVDTFLRLLDADILGSPVPANPSDNLALLIVESGSVHEQLMMIEGSKRTGEFGATHEAGAILSLDDSLTFGSQYERQLTGQGVGPVELTVVSIVYEPDSG
jgi:hypothetical protein